MDPDKPLIFFPFQPFKSISLALIFILGLILIGCSNRSVGVNDPSTQVVPQSLPEFQSDVDLPGSNGGASNSDSIDPDGMVNVGLLIDALKAEGYTQEEIKEILDALIRELEGIDDMSTSSLLFMQLMSLLKPSQDDKSPGQSMQDTNRGSNDNNYHAPLNNFDPEMELSSKYPICPSIPRTDPVIPPAPYDEQVGDCALRGKSDEIEAWLTALEQISVSCQANREINWAAAVAARVNLDGMIDKLEEIEIETTQGHAGGTSVNTGVNLVLGLLQAVFVTGGSSSGANTDPMTGLMDPNTNPFTYKLQSIGENVEIYCTMIDEIIKPLWLACIEISFHQDGGAPDPRLYHSLIDLGMNDAQVNYDSTDLFYTNTLQTDGWDDFRSTFNAAALDCPLDPQAPNTKFTFYENAFCRRGPSSEYEKVATFLEGQDVPIEGRNRDEPRWWMVLIPDSSEHCWVSDSTGSAAGFLEDLEIVAAPPLGNQCSKDLGESACLAAGGTWVKKDVPGGIYCDCK